MRISAILLPATVVITAATACVSLAGADETDENTELTAERYQEVVADLDKFASGMSRIRAEIDRSQFDAVAVADDRDYDAAQLIEFVEREIAFEAYPGLLRGPRGTLMSRAGNALDQSVLLASLLKDAGYDARIARGVLSPEQAAELVGQMTVRKNNASPFRDSDAIRQIFIDVMSSLGVSKWRPSSPSTPPEPGLPLRDTAEFSDSAHTFEMLRERLSANGAYRFSSTMDEKIAEEARDYFWVEYKDSPSTPWKAVHVAFKGSNEARGIDQLAASEYFADEIPADLQHRVRFRAYIDQKLGDKVVEHVLIDAYERPAANVAGVPVELSIFPMDLFAEQEFTHESLEAAINTSSVYVAALSDGSLVETAYFDVNGNKVDPLGAGNPAAGVLGTVGDRFGQAAGALAGKADRDEFVRLQRIRVQYELIAPGGQVTRTERVLYDRDEALTDPRRTPRSRIAQRLSFMALTGEVSPAFFFKAHLDRIVSAIPLMKLALRPASQRKSAAESLRELNEVNSTWIGHLQLFSMFDLGAQLFASNGLSYRSGTNLISHQQDFEFDKMAEIVDIVSNERRSFIIEDDGPRFSKQLMMQIGIWETRMEGLLTAGASNETFNTFRVIEDAESKGVEIAVVEPGNDGALSDLAMSPMASLYAGNDLGSGNFLVVPSETTLDSGRTGWWRINQETGQTLGMGDDGRGVEITEAMISRVVVRTAISGILCIGAMNYVGATWDRTALTCAGAALAVGIGAGVGAWGEGVLSTTSWTEATFENWQALEWGPGLTKIGAETLGPPAGADLAATMGPVLGWTAAAWALFFGVVGGG
jgi:hypothetical protein